VLAGAGSATLAGGWHVRQASPNGGRTSTTYSDLSRNANAGLGQLDLVEVLKAKNLEVIDDRTNGGGLWVLGGPELSDLLEEFRAGGLRFTHLRSGRRLTGNRPAWYTWELADLAADRASK